MKIKQHSPPHPGKILQELYLEPSRISRKQMSRISKIDFGHLTSIVGGDSRITVAIANKLAKVFGTTPDLWNNMQKCFDDWFLENN